ncbi:MAG: hypothetical protein HUJ68_07515 [Clostridia bacterium]|nr:hypothetical protein [Clostridia bacterium]
MKHFIKHGTTVPTPADLDEFQLGWCTSDKKLYIKDNGEIKDVSSTVIMKDNTTLFSEGASISPLSTYRNEIVTSDNLKLTTSFDFSAKVFNFKAEFTDGKTFNLTDAITHKEYATADGFKSDQGFATLTGLTVLDLNLIDCSDAINNNIMLEMFFTIEGFNYKIVLMSAEADDTTITVVQNISRTISS